MATKIKMAVDSYENFQDMVGDGIFANLQEYKEELNSTSTPYGVKIKKLLADEEADQIIATLEYNDINKLKGWVLSESPELSSEEVDEIVQGI
jgi:hypothetical protein